MRKALASLVLGATMLVGATACTGAGTGVRVSDSGYVDEVQYGYYDSLHHYHYYTTPKQVRVTRSYYTAHSYEYHPHGTQHTVTVHHTTTTTTTHHVTGHTTTTTRRATTTHRTTTRRTTTRHR